MRFKTMNSTFTIKVICAILFILFSFCYLYYYQADLMAMAQHVLSEGKTCYNRLIGAVLITVVLWGVQLCLQSQVLIPKRFYAVTYFPSLLVLTILTDISPDIDKGFSLGSWLWVFPCLLLLYGGVIWLLNRLYKIEGKTRQSNFFGSIWPNFSLLFIMFMLTCTFSNHNEVFHYRMKIEQKLVEGDLKTAAEVGKLSMHTDSSLTMLRIYNLSLLGKLGHQLFEYPLVGHADAMLPNGSSVKMMYAPEGALYRHLGAPVKKKVDIYTYLNLLKQHHRATKAAHDYELCAYLLDKKLALFAKTLEKYYPQDEHLPKHYKEALTLIRHRMSTINLQYHEDVMETDFADFKTLERKYTNPQMRYAALADAYRSTYWFYYLYH